MGLATEMGMTDVQAPTGASFDCFINGLKYEGRRVTSRPALGGPPKSCKPRRNDPSPSRYAGAKSSVCSPNMSRRLKNRMRSPLHGEYLYPEVKPHY